MTGYFSLSDAPMFCIAQTPIKDELLRAARSAFSHKLLDEPQSIYPPL
jgi:hypothetical protein